MTWLGIFHFIIFPGNITHDPALPAAKTEIYQRMPVGYLIKVIITYKKVSQSLI
jgi:hypothetical protein